VACERLVDGGEQIGCYVRFYYVSGRACCQGNPYEIRIVMHRKKDDFRGHALLYENLCRGYSIHDGHGNVHQNDIGIQSQGFIQSRLSVTHTTDNLADVSQKARNFGQHFDVVVGDQDSNCGRQ
jgi:hypothetical protein